MFAFHYHVGLAFILLFQCDNIEMFQLICRYIQCSRLFKASLYMLGQRRVFFHSLTNKMIFSIRLSDSVFEFGTAQCLIANQYQMKWNMKSKQHNTTPNSDSYFFHIRKIQCKLDYEHWPWWISFTIDQNFMNFSQAYRERKQNYSSIEMKR